MAKRKRDLEFGVGRINASWKIIDHLTKCWKVLAHSSRLEVVISDLMMNFDEMKEAYQKT